LLTTIRATGAERVGVTHGYINTLVRYLSEQGLDAYPIETRFEAEASEEAIENEDLAPNASNIDSDQSAENESPIESFSEDLV